eukprot:5755126-Amphidinium_carterae.1
MAQHIPIISYWRVISSPITPMVALAVTISIPLWTPHPGMLGSVLLANNPREYERFSCKYCAQNIKGGGNRKGKTHKFRTCLEVVTHLMSLHLGTQQHEEMIDEHITIRQMVHFYFGRDLMIHPLPLGTIGMMPRSLPHHFTGRHNRRIADHPFYYDSNGDRPDHTGPHYPGSGKAVDVIPPAKGKGRMDDGKGKIGPPPMRGPPPRADPVEAVPTPIRDPSCPRESRQACRQEHHQQLQLVLPVTVPSRAVTRVKPAPSAVHAAVPIVLTAAGERMVNQARGEVNMDGTPVPQVAQIAFKPPPLPRDDSEANQRAWR